VRLKDLVAVGLSRIELGERGGRRQGLASGRGEGDEREKEESEGVAHLYILALRWSVAYPESNGSLRGDVSAIIGALL